MDERGEKRCPHFQLYAEPLNINSGPNLLAVRRCMLTERLVGLLAKTSDGNRLTQKMVVRIHIDKDVGIVGPDLEAVTQTACTVKRCEDRCTPSYVAHLEHFNGTDPHMDEVTCLEKQEDAEEVVSGQISTPCSKG